MPQLLLGPVQRYVAETEATIWVETDGPCEVEVLGHRARTFEVAGHHYGLVVVDGLEPGRSYEYGVTLDRSPCWPDPESEFPPSTIRTPAGSSPITIVFGSCRVTAPHEPPWTLAHDEHENGLEHDALYALARRMIGSPEDWPDRLLMLGDQVYVDEGAPATRERIRARRSVEEPPGLEVADFEEYTWLYHEAWGEPTMRWLLSNVASAMLWDDHDMHDDWNISASWVEEMRALDWWRERVRGGIVSYWIYQHLGNLSPSELGSNELFAAVRDGSGDAWPMLRDFADRADTEAEGTRWSWCREFAGIRVVGIDSRAGRVLEGQRHRTHEHGRAMVDDREWEWIEEHVTGDVDHLVVATSLPLFMAPGLHYLEAWSEAVCDGAWGRPLRGLGERTRRALDLESWAAFQDSFHRLVRLLRDVSLGRHGRAPASIVVVAGDVHHAYVAEVVGDGSCPIYQAVCSPFRNALARRDRRMLRFATSRGGDVLARALARSARVEHADMDWEVTAGPWFDNQMATLRYSGPSVSLAIDKTIPGDRDPDLERTFSHELA